MDILNALKTRYSTKSFDPDKNLSSEQISQLEDLLQFSPSSTNIQPWHFILATTDEGKKRISTAAEGFYSYNKSKVLDASAIIVFSSKVDLTDEYLKHISDVEDADGRFRSAESKKKSHAGRRVYAHMHKFDYKDFQHWAEKQVYLNLGNFLLGVSALGLDAAPMEGFDLKVLDKEFGLRKKGFTSSFVVAVGYHKEGDFNKALPKSRLAKSEIIEKI